MFEKNKVVTYLSACTTLDCFFLSCAVAFLLNQRGQHILFHCLSGSVCSVFVTTLDMILTGTGMGTGRSIGETTGELIETGDNRPRWMCVWGTRWVVGASAQVWHVALVAVLCVWPVAFSTPELMIFLVPLSYLASLFEFFLTGLKVKYLSYELCSSKRWTDL